MSVPSAEPSRRVDLRARVLTGVVGAVVVIGVVLTFSPPLAFLVWLVSGSWAGAEFVRIARIYAPTAPVGVLWAAVPAMALVGFWAIQRGADLAPLAPMASAFAVVLVASLANLLSKAEMRDATVGTGLVAFAIPYFAVAPVALYRLHLEDRWLLFLVLALVAVGDTAAYFVGRSLGRRPLAPRVSPKKTWEGSFGGFLASVAVVALWSQWRLGEVRAELLAVAAFAAISAQLGDLVESAVKRGAGVKDSAQILPGHGGLYDRLDAVLLAAPTFLLGLWLVGFDVVRP